MICHFVSLDQGPARLGEGVKLSEVFGDTQKWVCSGKPCGWIGSMDGTELLITLFGSLLMYRLWICPCHRSII